MTFFLIALIFVIVFAVIGLGEKGRGCLIGTVVLSSLILVSIYILNFFFKDTWHCSVYLNRKNLKDSIQIGKFDTLQECGLAAINTLEKLKALDNGDYECGKNCKTDSDYPGLLICKETKKADIPYRYAANAYPGKNISDSS